MNSTKDPRAEVTNENEITIVEDNQVQLRINLGKMRSLAMKDMKYQSPAITISSMVMLRLQHTETLQTVKIMSVTPTLMNSKERTTTPQMFDKRKKNLFTTLRVEVEEAAKERLHMWRY